MCQCCKTHIPPTCPGCLAAELRGLHLNLSERVVKQLIPSSVVGLYGKIYIHSIADVPRSQAMSNKPVPFPYHPSSSLHFADMRPTFLSMFKNVFLPQRLDAFRDVVQRMPAGLKRTPSGTLADGSVYQRLPAFA